MIEKSEGKSFFDADAAGAEIAVGKRCGNELGGAFVFLPNANVDGEAHEFAYAGFFEGGRNNKGLAGAREGEGKEALAEAPADAGEIVKGRAWTNEESVELGVELGHEFLGVEEAGVQFVGSNGVDAVAGRLVGGEWRRKVRGLR